MHSVAEQLVAVSPEIDLNSATGNVFAPIWEAPIRLEALSRMAKLSRVAPVFVSSSSSSPAESVQ